MAGKYQAYAEYKDSGVEWLGAIPVSWDKSFVKYWLVCSPCYGILKPDKYSGTDGVQVIRILDINDRSVKLDQLEVVSQSLSNEYSRTLITKGDLIVSVVGTLGRSFICDLEHEGMNLSRALARLQVVNISKARYLQYLIDSKCFEDYVNVTCTGAAQKVFNMEDLSNWSIPCSDDTVLKNIAKFLDHETAKIDTLIEKQQQLIKLLKEKRQAVISHAVTKGLNPDSPMRDSGVEWLGEVPAHWELGRLKNVLKIRNGRDYKDVETESGGYPVYGSGGEFKRSTAYLFDGKSVLFGRKGTVDRPLVVSGKFWTVDTMFYSEIYANAVAEYIYYQATMFPFDLLSTNTALPSMTQENLLELGFVMPPKDEQKNIVEFINKRCIQFDYLIDKAESAIKLIQERRTALISAAVTGKIDVRNWQAPELNNYSNKESVA